jgi:hypothetical protein
MFQPLIFELESGNSDILDKSKSDNIILSSTINLPLTSLGFHNFLHRTKNAMEITKNLETKNKFYYVINPFEHVIANYDDSLKNLTNIYLEIKEDAQEILSRGFYKMWEILFLFGVGDKKELTYASFAEGPGAFIQAVINYRGKLGPGIDKDKIFGVTIHTEKEKYIESGKQFLGFYNHHTPGLIKIHKTVSTNEAKLHKSKSNGDITQVKTISIFKKDIEKTKNYADLVTADSDFDWNDENYQEQEGYQLILGEIVGALRVQSKDGSFVIKFFETFTIPSIKMIYLLSSFYEHTYIYKPYFSRASNSEKYVVCKGFKYDQKKDLALLNSKIGSLEKVLEQMNTIKFVFDIYPDMDLPIGYLNKFKFMNIKIANSQQIMINEIVKYIKENNYFGEKYHSHREKQIEATKWWVNNFYPPSKNLYEKTKDDMAKILKSAKEKYEMEQEKFIASLV